MKAAAAAVAIDKKSSKSQSPAVNLEFFLRLRKLLRIMVKSSYKFEFPAAIKKAHIDRKISDPVGVEQGAGHPARAHVGPRGADLHLDLRGAAGGDHGQVHRAEGH